MGDAGLLRSDPGAPQDRVTRGDPLTSPTTATRATSLSLGFVAACIAVSGLLTYVYLAVVARSSTPADYSYFGAFWSLALIVGFGAFLPIEQALAHALQDRGGRRAVLRSAATVAGGIAAAQLVLLAAVSPLLWPAIGGRPATLVALGALCLVSAAQFVVRGVLVGLGRLRMHGLVLLGDSALRVLLASGVALIGSADSATFAWTLVAAVALAHVPMLPGLVRRAGTGHDNAGHDDAGHDSALRPLGAAVAPLLLGALCAQLLLNGIPVLVSAVASAAEQGRAGQFLAAFTLARIPLFVLVPLQSAIIPALTVLATAGPPAALARMLGRTAAAIVALGAVGVAVALALGPWLVQLVFGAQYRLPGADLALMVAGVGAHVGLLLVTQALIATSRQRDVALSWLAALAVAGTVFAVVPDLLLRAELAFLAGSATGWVVGNAQILGHRTREEALPCPGE
jgi:O-antigen/teichoic acid export membrane protein